MTKNEILLSSSKTVFSLQDLAVLWNQTDHRKVVELVKYYLRKKKLIPIRRGIYTINKEYSDLDLAQKLITPSYITYHTALSIHGINHQYYTEIHSSSLESRRIKVDNKTFVYHKIPSSAFFTDRGLLHEKGYTICSPERTVCESLLFNKNIGFDYLEIIDATKLTEISQIYDNKSLEKRIQKLIKTQINQ